jgi:hypothetical protein
MGRLMARKGERAMKFDSLGLGGVSIFRRAMPERTPV